MSDFSSAPDLDLLPPGAAAAAVPALAAARRAGARTVCVLDVPQPDGTRLHWLDTVHARGWLSSESRINDIASSGHGSHSNNSGHSSSAGSAGSGSGSGANPVGAVDRGTASRPEAHDVHGTRGAASERGDRFRRAFGEARARGFVGADSAILAVLALDGALPRLSWSEAPVFAVAAAVAGERKPLGIYALLESAARLREVLAAGVSTVQLRIKAPPQPDDAWRARLREALQDGIVAAQQAGAELFVNDHWQEALALGAPGVHLGQEDLLALGDAGRAALLGSGVALGVSSHSLWELCRARALAPRYIACGPVWPTTTKDMPWVPQGLDNLAWWCRMAQAPVVAIGGILTPEQVREAAACGADGVCVVRGLGDAPARVLPALQAAFAQGRAAVPTHAAAPGGPHPTLPVE
ncbi:thiamine phosphate synthase [Ramlibacter sp. AN1015]|uniref:thiamine phosphate synthase n=1 Tax=Ramlibacter sp. AN1015 TaxID=3133428 RepID=UPI0030BE6020